MTIRDFFAPFYIHPIVFIFIFISFVTGTFIQLFIILVIVMVHEMGHYIAAKIYNWRINRVMLWIFGGVMETEEHGNRPLYEDFIVTIAGPFQHIFIYIFGLFMSTFGFLPEIIVEQLMFFNTVILLFNLLPIWPLDGGKLLFYILAFYMPFRKAHHWTIILSLCLCLGVMIVQLFILPFTLATFLIFAFLIMENRLEWKRRTYVFMRFLMKRSEGNSEVRSMRPIVVHHTQSLQEVLYLLQRDKKHSIYVTFPNRERLIVDEAECLRGFFYEKKYKKTIGDIAMGSL